MPLYLEYKSSLLHFLEYNGMPFYVRYDIFNTRTLSELKHTKKLLSSSDGVLLSKLKVFTNYAFAAVSLHFCLSSCIPTILSSLLASVSFLSCQSPFQPLKLHLYAYQPCCLLSVYLSNSSVSNTTLSGL